jgi:hypothetical protein
MTVNPGTQMMPGYANANEFVNAGGIPQISGNSGYVFMGPNAVPAPSKQESAKSRALARSAARRAAAEIATGQVGIGGMATQIRPYTPNTAEQRSYLPIDQVASDVYWATMTPKEQQQFRDAYSQATGSRIRSEFQFINGWKQAVVGAANFSAQAGRPITPMEYAQLLGANAAGPRGGGGGGGSRTSVVVDLTNPSDAQIVVDNALTSYLGRRATEEELSSFLSTLNKAERKNPVVTSPTQRSGGVNRELVAREFAESRDEAAETMVNSQYMGWFEQLMSRDVTEGIESGL